MADTPSTGNATPTVDQAAPTDTTTAQSTEGTVQLAQAAAAAGGRLSPSVAFRTVHTCPNNVAV